MMKTSRSVSSHPMRVRVRIRVRIRVRVRVRVRIRVRVRVRVRLSPPNGERTESARRPSSADRSGAPRVGVRVNVSVRVRPPHRASGPAWTAH